MVDHVNGAEEQAADDSGIGNDETSLDGASDVSMHARGMDGGPVDTPAIPLDDVLEGSVGSLHGDGEEGSAMEAINLDHNSVNTVGTLSIDLEPANPLRSVIAELTALQSRVTQLEAQLGPGSIAREAKSPSKKRKRNASGIRGTKRVKPNQVLNISTTSVYVYWNETPERCAYTWKRGRGGRCWVSDDREYLLCCATEMSIGIRTNADWLPIELRFNEDTQAFEGQTRVGSRRLEVDSSVIMDIICGDKDKHIALVPYR
jgi:hypothetical protein